MSGGATAQASSKSSGFKGWWQRSTLRKLWRQWDTADQPVYVAHYIVEMAFDLPKDMTSKTYEGLLCCQVLVDGSVKQLNTAWANREYYRAAKNRFEAQIIGARKCFSGQQDQFRAKLKRWWDRPKFLLWFGYTGFATLIAFLGWYQVMRNNYEYFYADPEIQMVAPTKPIHCLVDEPFEVKLPLRNTAWSGRADVRITEVAFVDVNGQATNAIEQEEFQEKVFLLTTPGSTQHFLVQATPKEKGNFFLKVETEVRAGRLKDAKAVEFQREIQVWKERDHEVLAVVSENEKECDIEVMLHFGRAYPTGIKGTVIIKGAKIIYVQPELQLRSHGEPTYQSLQGHESAPSTLEWTLEPITRPRHAKMLVHIEDQSGTPKSKDDWEKIAKDMEIPMDPLREED